jgi:anthranilate synthase/aminodeoxychorismate synthase-like glutamine amidotransferase
MIALIDNYDSFTYNIYDYLSRYRPVKVFRNTGSLSEVASHKPEGIVLSPGPSHPANSLLTLDVIRSYEGKVPILGICLGMQAIAFVSGNTVRKARRIMHGKVDTVENRGGLLFKGLEKEFPAVRYHSLVVDIDRGGFDVSAVSKSDGEIMAIEDRSRRIFGLQFHPESYATENGLRMIQNFLEVCYGEA